MKAVRPTLGNGDHSLVVLTQRRYARIDNEDVERVGQFNWHLKPKLPKKQHTRKTYARRAIMENGRIASYQSLHRFIMDAPDDLNVLVESGDYLDCRKANLKMVLR